MLLFKTDISVYSCIAVHGREQMEYPQWHKLCAIKHVTKIMEQEKINQWLYLCYSTRLLPKMALVLESGVPSWEGHKHFWGKHYMWKNGVLRPHLFCFLHKLPTHMVYILSQCIYCLCMDENLWWSQSLERIREPARTNKSAWREDTTANFVVLDAHIVRNIWMALGLLLLLPAIGSLMDAM